MLSQPEIDVQVLPKPHTLKDYLSDFKEPLAVILSLGSSLWLFITNLKVSSNFREFSSDVTSFLTFVEFINVIVLITAIFMLVRKYDLIIKDKNAGTPHLMELEPDIPSINEAENLKEKKEEVDWKIERVNKLVSQLVLSLQGFAVVLLFMYTLLSLTDLKPSKLDENDIKLMKKEDFINDSTEATDPNSEYYKIIDSFDKKSRQAVWALNKRTDTSKFSHRSAEYLLSTFLKDQQQSIKDTLKIKSLQSKYNGLVKSQHDFKKYQVSLDSIEKFYNLKAIKLLANDRREIGTLKIRNTSLQTKSNLIDLIYAKNQSDRFAMRYLVIEFVENAFNLFSAAFLFIAFQVLFTITLAEDNRTSFINSWLPFSIAGAILLVNFLGIVIGIGSMPLSSISHLVRLMSGTYNGVGMMLLFGRFISIEYFYKNAKGFKRKFYYVGTIFVFPLYAVAQPLYGIFDLENKDIGNALLLKAVILLICFIGKLILFLFVSLILENEWIHKYFYWILLKKDSMENISLKINEDLKLID